jgi:predicted MFS family arabinose efflux permease
VPPSVPTVAPVWRDRDFRRLWAGQTASQFGEQAGQVTLPLIAVLTLHTGPGALGVLRAVEQAPLLLFSLLAGAWVDRRRVRDVMLLADLGRALTLAAVPLACVLGLLGMPLLLVVALLAGTLSVLFDVAYQASLARMLTPDQLPQGNAVLEGSRSAAQLGGPALGGAAVSLLSAPIAVGSGALCFVLSCLSIRRIRRAETLPAPGERPTGLRRQIAEGLRLVVGDPSLRAVGVASALYQFSFAAMMTVYLLFLPRTLHLSGAEVGLVLAAMGPGAVAGSVLAARLPRRFGYGRVLVLAAALADAVMACSPELRGAPAVTVPALMAVNVLFGGLGQLVDVTAMAVRQAATPVGLQGRVAATVTFVGMGLTPLGSLLGGLLATQWGLPTSLLLAIVGMSLSPLFMAFSPLARLGRTLPTAADRL